MEEFKSRAECRGDAESFQQLLSIADPEATLDITPDEGGFPDVDIAISSNLSLDELRAILRGVTDGHVMLQTIQSSSQYTGERNYGLE